MSYRELIAESRKVANSILTLTKRQRPVLVQLPNSINSLECMLGCFFAGACFIPVIGDHMVPSLLEKFSPGLFVGTTAAMEAIGAEYFAAHDLHCCVLDGSSSLASSLEALAASSSMLDIVFEPEWPAVALYTSGSTGAAKCAVHTYNTLNLLTCELADKLSYDNTDRSLVCLQMSRAFCLTSQILPALFAGATLVIHDGFDAASVLSSIREDGITRLYLYGRMYQELAMLSDAPKPNSLRSCVGGAEMCAPATISAFERSFGLGVFQSMGMVETLAHSLNMSQEPGKKGSAGLPVCGTQISILDDDGRFLPAGETGEIAVDTPLLMRGYFGQPPLANHSFRTGDLGYIDADGYLWFLARRTADQDVDLLTRIRQLNDAIINVRGIADAIVIGCSNGLVAFICAVPHSDKDKIFNEVEALNGGLVHLRIEVRDSLPKLPGGKLDLLALQRLANQA